jgi:hypothetical protein
VIPNAIPPWPPISPGERAEARKRFQVSGDDFVVAYPAHFRDGKGHRYLPELAMRLRESTPCARILAAGDTTGDSECRRNSSIFQAAIARDDLSRTIRCLGLLPAIRPLLAASDVTLNLSDMEGMSNTIMEGMALGWTSRRGVGGTPARRDAEDGWSPTSARGRPPPSRADLIQRGRGRRRVRDQ